MNSQSPLLLSNPFLYASLCLRSASSSYTSLPAFVKKLLVHSDGLFVRSLLLPFLLFVVFVSLLILCCFRYSSCLSLPFHFSLVSSLLFSLSLLFSIFFVLCLLRLLSASPLKPSSATSLRTLLHKHKASQKRN